MLQKVSAMNKISHFVFNIFLTQNIRQLMEINLYKIYLPLFSPFSNNTKESGNFLKKLLSYNVLSTHLNWITNLVYCVYCLVTQGIYELVVLLKIVKSVIVIAKTKSSKNIYYPIQYFCANWGKKLFSAQFEECR